MPKLGLTHLTNRIMRAGEGRMLRKLEKIVAEVNLFDTEFRKLPDSELQSLTGEFKERYAEGESLDELLPEAFAAMREAAARTLGMRHFDVQIMGGAALHLQCVAEMRTGEGKTLVATLPLYLNALTGEGAHLVTVNDYLAERDATWMGAAYRFLGLTVGVIKADMSPADRRAAYACDITYGTNTEFGFDYLRDNMAWTLGELVQRGHHFAVVDEADSILVDEARTPLIISGPADQPTQWYDAFVKFAAAMNGVLVQEERFTSPLQKDELAEIRSRHHYEYDPKKRTVAILESGVAFLEDQLGIDNFYDSVHTPLIGHLNNALKAKELFKKDKDYVVMGGEVLIVDEHTGRLLTGRRYNDGLHQAIEAKEGVEIKNENQTLATVTLQNFFRLYGKGLSGMTGTAMTEAAEFHQIYQLQVVPIPTNRPMVRRDEPDLVYRTEDAKYQAVVTDIAERYATGQPVLVGTVSVEKSEHLSGLLRRRGIPHEVLNARNHRREAEIVARAGRRGAVTVATNMAGRGTDIMLGGGELPQPAEEAPGQAPAEAPPAGAPPVEDPHAADMAYDREAEAEEVKSLGGLYVLGTERHESRRIDNQLRGRAGRQGDPGASRFYLSLEDSLMLLFRAQAVDRVMTMANLPDDVPIENKLVTRAVAAAQSQLERQNFEARKDLLKYDEVMDRQRKLIYAERRRVLEGEDLRSQVGHFMDDTTDAYVAAATAEGYAEEWDLERLWTALRELYPITLDYDELLADPEGLTAEALAAAVRADIHERYAARESELGGEVLRELERRVLLAVLDRKWREHLYEMDYLREGIGLRSMLGREPVFEYQRDGFEMFTAMMDAIKEETVGFLFHLRVDVAEEPADLAPPPEEGLRFSAPTMDTEDGVVTRGTDDRRGGAKDTRRDARRDG
ncbi:preprotein translocase subunit SecA [Streptomyces sp. NBC_00237]|uniref:preprotein translocase subunit SecA n=1 Tax=Streptomyces sp. NBC_00237 TaxID=2975687 RepID=UPI0022519AE4|nr:preprotein translocase subunit SecA [Streptomyces sp. NBC_00237]MCX5203865.1 preprotein translocase subunit SecA [Streptomyces sp. NBC_00237]